MGVLTLIGSALSSRLAGYLGIAASIGLAVWLVVVESQLVEAHGQIEKITKAWQNEVRDHQTCEANGRALNSALEKQSKAYADLSAMGLQAVKDSDAAIAKLADASATARSLARAVLAMKPQADECKANYEILGKAGR